MADRPAVAGVGISHPDRVVFPAIGVTKLDLARYYASIADWILPHLIDRPLTLVRCPGGIPTDSGTSGCFFMKHSRLWAPPALRRVRIREQTKVGDYLIADSLPAFVALVQMGVFEIYTWNSRFTRLEQRDRLVIDIDPGERISWTLVVRTARLVRAMLRALHLESFVKTTGGRGLHVVVPLAPKARWSETLEFARAVAAALLRLQPDRLTARFAKSGREGKLLIDNLRNNRTNTSVAAFSTRARPGAPVSVPLAWSELTASRTPDRFSVRTVPRRLASLRVDPWKDYWTMKQIIPRDALAALERL